MTDRSIWRPSTWFSGQETPSPRPASHSAGIEEEVISLIFRWCHTQFFVCGLDGKVVGLQSKIGSPLALGYVAGYATSIAKQLAEGRGIHLRPDDFLVPGVLMVLCPNERIVTCHEKSMEAFLGILRQDEAYLEGFVIGIEDASYDEEDSYHISRIIPALGGIGPQQ